MRRPTAILWALALLGRSQGPLWADPVPTASREEFQQAYANQLQNSPIFASAPIYHIVPAENNITFAAAASYTDVTVAPRGTDISSRRLGLPERLDLSGWSASPYVALSTKQFGIGFTGDVGKGQTHYLRLGAPTDPRGFPGGAAYQEQYSSVSYSGVGLYLYVSPSWKLLPHFVTLTFIGGARSLNVVQEDVGTLTNPSQTAALSKFRYAVQNFEGGCNLGFRLVKRFTVIPWVDYSTNFVTTPTLTTEGAAVSGAAPSATGPTADDPAVKDNVNLYWRTQPALRYGIDFAVKIESIDLHLGGLLGLLGSLNKGSDRIQDNSRYVSISLDMKGS